MRKTLKYLPIMIALTIYANFMNAKTVAIVGIDQDVLPGSAAANLQGTLPFVPTAAMGELGHVIDTLKAKLNSTNNLVNAWDEARSEYIKNKFIENANYDEIIILTGNDVKVNGTETLLMQALDSKVDAIDVYALVHADNDFWNFMEEENIGVEFKNKFRFLYSESCHGADETNSSNIINKAKKYGYDSIIAFNGQSSSPLITFEFINMFVQRVPLGESLEFAHTMLVKNLNSPQIGPVFSLLTQALAGYSDNKQILSNTANTLFYSSQININDQTIASINQSNKVYIKYNKIIIE